MRLEVGAQSVRLLVDGRLGLGRHQPRHRSERRRRRLGRLERRRLLDDQVGVGPADPERGDPGSARALAALPWLRLGQELDRARVPIDVRRGLLDVERRRQHPSAQRQHHLDHSSHARGSDRVADVRLQRPEPQRALGALLAVGGDQRLGLDRVAERGAGAVRLDRVDVGRPEPGVRERLADHALLRRPVRRRQPVARAVLVDRAAADHPQHPVAEAKRVRHPLEHDQAGTVRERNPVRPRRERLAAPIRR